MKKINKIAKIQVSMYDQSTFRVTSMNSLASAILGCECFFIPASNIQSDLRSVIKMDVENYQSKKFFDMTTGEQVFYDVKFQIHFETFSPYQTYK